MILVMGCVFVFWAFFSFFVHMLVAVLFPVVAGLVLGFWVYMWRWVQFDMTMMIMLVWSFTIGYIWLGNQGSY